MAGPAANIADTAVCWSARRLPSKAIDSGDPTGRSSWMSQRRGFEQRGTQPGEQLQGKQGWRRRHGRRAGRQAGSRADVPGKCRTAMHVGHDVYRDLLFLCTLANICIGRALMCNCSCSCSFASPQPSTTRARPAGSADQIDVVRNCDCRSLNSP